MLSKLQKELERWKLELRINKNGTEITQNDVNELEKAMQGIIDAKNHVCMLENLAHNIIKEEWEK